MAYELGFAERELGRGQLILIMNEEFGSYDDMPFDLGKRMIARFTSTSGKLAAKAKEELYQDLRRRIEGLVRLPQNTSEVELLNKSERSLLYWAHTVGNGYISNGNRGNGFIISAGMRISGRPLHESRRQIDKARYLRAIEMLIEKGYLAVVSSEKTYVENGSWALTEEGEVLAERVSLETVYPLPKVDK